MSKIEKYRINAMNSIQTSLTYRFQFFSGIFILLIPFVIKLSLWKLAFMPDDTKEIAGYTFNELLVYTIFSMIFSYLNITYFQYNIAFEIKDGSLSRYLVKPVNHMLYWISMLIGDKFINVIYVLVFIILAGGIYGNNMDGYIAVCNIPFTIVTIILSLILNFLIYYVISLSAFWFLEISYFFSAITFIISILSGELMPIDVMPTFVTRILLFLPFSYSVYFPTQVIMGELAIKDILFRLIIQIVWITVFVLFGRLVWNMGVRKYESVGG